MKHLPPDVFHKPASRVNRSLLRSHSVLIVAASLLPKTMPKKPPSRYRERGHPKNRFNLAFENGLCELHTIQSPEKNAENSPSIAGYYPIHLRADNRLIQNSKKKELLLHLHCQPVGGKISLSKIRRTAKGHVADCRCVFGMIRMQRYKKKTISTTHRTCSFFCTQAKNKRRLSASLGLRFEKGPSPPKQREATPKTDISFKISFPCGSSN